jgi:hypothetical protein
MAGMEIQEDVLIDGQTAKLENPMIHHNVTVTFPIYLKHNEYSTWEAKVWLNEEKSARLSIRSQHGKRLSDLRN